MDAGSTTALPGDSGSYVIYSSNSSLLVSAGGHNESIDVPVGATVSISSTHLALLHRPA